MMLLFGQYEDEPLIRQSLALNGEKVYQPLWYGCLTTSNIHKKKEKKKKEDKSSCPKIQESCNLLSMSHVSNSLQH